MTKSSQKAWMKIHQKRLLDKGKIEKLVIRASLHRLNQSRSGRKDSHRGGLLREKCRAHALPQLPPPTPLCRLGRHRSRLQDRDRFQRLKQSGMFWTVRGANAIIALRCCHLNGRFEDYWEARRAA